MISSPHQLRALDIHQLGELAEDLRQRIITVCLQNGGHLGASLGTVEMAIALHREMNSPEEPIIWDVGHQAYSHKLLTGRWEAFSKLRQLGGPSGFLSRAESPHDFFGAGHSSTSLSAALAAAWARRGTASWTTAVIGDGGLTAGLALEALQQIRGLELGPLLIVINDNQMSISPNVGAIPAILAEGKAAAFFDALGLDYVGPMDGHDLSQILGFLEGVKKNYLGRPVVLHLLTQKGRGYEPAESDPAGYHGISPVGAGAIPPADSGGLDRNRPSWSEVFSRQVRDWARTDKRIVAITAAMPEGTGLSSFAQEFPDRFFDVGIAEGHALTFAAGLAAQGLIPIVALYSTFAQRGIDSLLHDIALQGLGVIVALDRAGIVGADGPTHHGAFDLVFSRMIPNVSIHTPSTGADLDQIFRGLKAANGPGGPLIIRYPRGPAPSGPAFGGDEYGKTMTLDHGGGLRITTGHVASVLLISVGHASEKAARAASRVVHDGHDVTHVNLKRIKPLPEELLELLSSGNYRQVITVEEGARNGGVGELIASICSNYPMPPRVSIIGYQDQFLPHGTLAQVEEFAGVSSENIEEQVRRACERNGTS